MARYDYRVRVYESRIHGMFEPGGEVNREASKIAREVEVRAIAKATRFARTGEIAASHRINVAPTGLYGVFGQVENVSGHARYKHEGTTEGMVIRSRRSVDRRGGFGGKMRLRPWGQYGYLFRSEVSGYHPGSAEPWLRNAANEVLLRYRVRVSDAGDLGLD